MKRRPPLRLKASGWWPPVLTINKSNITVVAVDTHTYIYRKFSKHKYYR